MDRTVVLVLNPTPDQAATLLTTISAYTACFNMVAAEGYTSGCYNGVELHKRTYYPLWAVHPTLPAQLVVSSRMKATEAVKSAVVRAKAGRKVRQPHAQFCPIRYDLRSYWVKWDAATCSLATSAGRLELGFIVPAHSRKYLSGPVASADLIYKGGRWRLQVVVRVPAPARR